MKGWVYIISNPAIPGVIKVGFSTKDPNERAKELGTGSPQPYKVEYEVLVNNPQDIEKVTHNSLADNRAGKEWFSCDISIALKAIKQACKEEDIYLEIFVQGDFFVHEKNKLRNSVLKEDGYFSESEKLPEVDESYELACKYDKGDGVKKNLKEAFRLYQASAEQGNLLGMAAVAKAYLQGRGTQKNVRKAIPFLQQSAKRGNPDAQYELAKLAYMGTLNTKEYKGMKEEELYFEFLLLSAEQHYPPAQCELGVFYALKYNNQLAFEFYKKAANQNYPLAQRHLADCYLEGKGIKRDLEMAKKWHQKAAEGKDKISQKRLENWEAYASEFYPD